MHRFHPRLSLLALLLVVAQGWGQATQPSETPAGTPTLRVIQAGEPPLGSLRLEAQVGKKETLEFTVSTSAEQTLSGKPIAQRAMPTIKMTLETEVTKVDDDGNITFEFEYTNARLRDEAGVAPADLSRMRQTMNLLVGLRGSGVTSDRGLIRKINMQIPRSAGPVVQQQVGGLKQLLKQMFTPFPLNAVGVGAQWEVSEIVKASGIIANQRRIFTVTGVSSDSIDLDVRVIQTASPQPVNLPGLPPGAFMRCRNFVSEGTWKIVLRRDQMFPASAKADGVTNSTLVMRTGDGDAEIRRHTRATMTVQSTPR